MVGVMGVSPSLTLAVCTDHEVLHLRIYPPEYGFYIDVCPDSSSIAPSFLPEYTLTSMRLNIQYTIHYIFFKKGQIK